MSNDDYKEISNEQLAIIVIFSAIINLIVDLYAFGFSWIVLPIFSMGVSVMTASLCYIIVLFHNKFK